MRTFIAFELSSAIKEELGRLKQEIKKVDADVKWSHPDNIHLTLKFLGNVEEEKIEQIKNILNEISSVEKPFEITLFKLGAFPSLDYPKVLWVGIDKNCSEVERIAKTLEDSLEKIGFEKEEKSFSAHLTLGRIKSGKNKAKLKEKLISSPVESRSSEIKGMTLFKSELTPKGPIYNSLHEASFKGG